MMPEPVHPDRIDAISDLPLDDKLFLPEKVHTAHLLVSAKLFLDRYFFGVAARMGIPWWIEALSASVLTASLYFFVRLFLLNLGASQAMALLSFGGLISLLSGLFFGLPAATATLLSWKLLSYCRVKSPVNLLLAVSAAIWVGAVLSPFALFLSGPFMWRWAAVDFSIIPSFIAGSTALLAIPYHRLVAKHEPAMLLDAILKLFDNRRFERVPENHLSRWIFTLALPSAVSSVIAFVVLTVLALPPGASNEHQISTALIAALFGTVSFCGVITTLSSWNILRALKLSASLNSLMTVSLSVFVGLLFSPGLAGIVQLPAHSMYGWYQMLFCLSSLFGGAMTMCAISYHRLGSPTAIKHSDEQTTPQLQLSSER